MPYAIRRSHERKFQNYGWLQTYYTFSFSNYYDPNFMGFRALRVINEDLIQPSRGFPLHEHDNMEIITVVLEGELAHQDSMGNTETIVANEVQVMSAGTGIHHSEFNPSDQHPVHLLQIWIIPDTKDVEPRYDQARLEITPNGWLLISSKVGTDLY